jgi:hypothetical protein
MAYTRMHEETVEEEVRPRTHVGSMQAESVKVIQWWEKAGKRVNEETKRLRSEILASKYHRMRVSFSFESQSRGSAACSLKNTVQVHVRGAGAKGMLGRQ